jgi:hypothetical protein
MDGVCVLPSGTYSGLSPDGKCAENSLIDPDCPLYCPPGRNGYSGYCCYNDGLNATVDCDTGEELNPTAWNNLQAIVTFGPEGQAGTSKALTNVANKVGWTAPSAFPSGLTSVKLWMESAPTLVPSNTLWTNAWASCLKSTGGSCYTKSTGFVALPSQSGHWISSIFNLGSLPTGTYTATYKYCYQDDSSALIPVAICNTDKYTIKVEGDQIGFSVTVDLT